MNHRDGAIHPGLILACVAVMLLLGFALRVWGLGEECPHWDEVASLRHLNASSLAEFLAELRNSDPPMTPVYFTIEYFWATLTGGSVLAMRSLSVLLSCISFPLFFLLARSLCGTAGALAGTLAFAMSIGQIYYAQEIRPYALILVITLLSAMALWRAQVEAKTRWWPVNVGCNILLMWTHLFTVFFLVSQGVFLLLRLAARQCRLRTVLFWVLAQCPSVALILLWVSSIDAKSLEVAASWRDQIHHSYLQLLGDFLLFCGAGVPMFRDLPAWSNGLNMGGVMWRFFGCVAGMYLILSIYRCRREPGERTKMIFLVTWAAVPSVTQFLVSALVYSCHGSRYVLYGSLPLLMMIGGSAGFLRHSSAKVLMAALMVGIYSVNLCAHPKPWRPDSARVLEQIAARDTGGNKPVVVFRGADVSVLEFMNRTGHALPPFSYATNAAQIREQLGQPVTGNMHRCLVLFQHELPDAFVREVESGLLAQGWLYEREDYGYSNPAFVYHLAASPANERKNGS